MQPACVEQDRTWENTVQRKPAFWRVFLSENEKQLY